MSEWPIKEKLNANAVEEIDRFQQKYTERMKNTMYGMICHAYNQGEKDGRLAAESHSKLQEKYEEGYRKGLESNCGAYNLGYEKGQTELLDALKVIAKRYGPNGMVVRSYVMNQSAHEIMSMAEYYRKNDESEKITPGDEVYWVSDDGKEYFDNSFIVTDYEEGNYIEGITFDGNTHFHDEKEYLHNWQKTGHHIDIKAFLKKMKEDAGHE